MTVLDPIVQAMNHPKLFSVRFTVFLRENLHVYYSFEHEALRAVGRGYTHYSARTIVEFMRHHSAVQQSGPATWKINNDHVPCLARLFEVRHPEHSKLFNSRRRSPGDISSPAS